MVAVTKHGVIPEKTDNSFENEGVFNPAIFQDGNTVHLFYRAVRQGNFSSIAYCRLNGPLTVVERAKETVFYNEKSYEFQGVEDPGITKIDSTFYMSYAACDGINVFGAYATSKDLKNFERKGIMTPKFTFVNNVVFPTGTALFNEDLNIYYGAADCRVAAASVNINALLKQLKN